jgi:hypothetical protein
MVIRPSDKSLGSRWVKIPRDRVVSQRRLGFGPIPMDSRGARQTAVKDLAQKIQPFGASEVAPGRPWRPSSAGRSPG